MIFTISDLSELDDDYKGADLDWPLAYSVLLRLLGEHEVETVMSQLSPELAARFNRALHEEFGNEELARNGLWIDNAGGEPPNRDRIVACILRWIAIIRE